MTREQAELLVKQAQDKAAADAANNAQAARDEENAVRVPYVPQIIKDEISKQVAEEVKPAVVESVVAEAKTEKWGIPGALPDWLSRVRPFGDVTFRSQADMYAKDNGAFLDFNGINLAGGIGKDALPYLNTTENRDRFRLRARLGLDAELTPNFTSQIRLSSGTLTDPSSESQTEGTYGQRYSVAIDRAYIRWNSSPAEQLSVLTAEGGRFENPWFSPTELVYARDLQFEGAAGSARWGWGSGGATRSQVYATFGAIPVLEVPTEISESKWLLGAQLGTNLRWADGAQHLQLAGGYYDFVHVTGVRNTPDSTLTNVTAPAFIRYGNTVFDIANSTTDTTANLLALAARFRLIDLAASYELSFHRYSLALVGEAVRNIGYKLADVEALTGQPIASPQNRGYVADISFGDPIVLERGAWRARIGYRYVQSDAVIDAWTDADFHEAGTNAAGYYLWGDLGIAKNVWLRVRYLSGNEITPGSAYAGGTPHYGVDIVQVDVNTRF
jgi:Putative porin